MFDTARIDQLVKSFQVTTMATAKILFIDVDNNLQPKGHFWSANDRDQRDLAGLFNAVSNHTEEFGEAWVIGGYHSSKAFVQYSESANSAPLRMCDVYRLSEIPGNTYDEKMENARYLAVTDNLSGQLTEG